MNKDESYSKDPLGYIRSCFDWERFRSVEPEFKGLHKWQIDTLQDISRQMKGGQEVVKYAIASGNGSGKTTLGALLILWFLDTRPRAQATILAVKESQVRNATWKTVQKFYNYWIAKSDFNITETKLYAKYHKEAIQADWQLWGANVTGISGRHDVNMMVILDEASEVPKLVWNHLSNYFTSSRGLFAAIGNPTTPDSHFAAIFRDKKGWLTKNVDVSDPQIVSTEWLDQKAREYGFNSELYNCHVRGLFPNQHSDAAINPDILSQCLFNKAEATMVCQPVIGVDLAATTTQYADYTAIVVRCAGTLLHIEKFKKNPNGTVERVIELLRKYDTETLCIDAAGVGLGISYLFQNVGVEHINVNYRHTAFNNILYHDRKTELFFSAREQIVSGRMSFGDNSLAGELCEELQHTRYETTERGKLKLTPKSDLRERIGRSPDILDAFMLTFATLDIPRERSAPYGGLFAHLESTSRDGL